MASAGHTPFCNRLLQKRWNDKKHKEHKDRLRNVKSSVDNGAPRNFVHIKQNVRKHKIEEERQSIIQKHNDQLVSRMHQIMSTTGRVDHRNADYRQKKSLNFVKRANDLDRINKDNQDILKRLQKVRPLYSLQTMDTDYMRHKERTKCISLFPPVQTTPPGVSAHHSDAVHSKRLSVLPPILEGKSSRPETHASEIKEEIEVDVED